MYGYEEEGPMRAMGSDSRAPATTPLNVFSDNIDRLAQSVEELHLRLDAVLRPSHAEKADAPSSPTYNRLTSLNEGFSHQLDRLAEVIQRIDL